MLMWEKEENVEDSIASVSTSTCLSNPVSVTEFPNHLELQVIYLTDTEKNTFLTSALMSRVIAKYNLVFKFAQLNLFFHKYGPYTICKITYRDPTKKYKYYTGFGLATKSHKDPENSAAGMNIAYVRALKELCIKYKRINGLL